MAQLAFIVVYLALAGALISWIIGAWFYARTLNALAVDRNRTPSSRFALVTALVAWPFARGRLEGAATSHAAYVNKALIAFFACLTIAVAATSVATNLARVSR
jgi:hypothetical protein